LFARPATAIIIKITAKIKKGKGTICPFANAEAKGYY